MPVKAIFFDAGNTLVFPDLAQTLAPLVARGLRPTNEQLHLSECFAKLKLDAARLAPEPPLGVDAQYWLEYYTHLLEQMGVTDSQLTSAMVLRSRTSANWSRVLPGTFEALEELRRKFRLGIISNSDGGISALLQNVGIAHFFESFTDSGNVGHEKPHPAIFAVATASLGVDPSESVYVGDIYSVDYLGAVAAGMQAVLMDISGTYRQRELPRVESLAGLLAEFSGRG